MFWIDECGHAPMMEHPEEFNVVLEKWYDARGIGKAKNSTMEINSVSFVKSSAHPRECPPMDKAEYAFIGRSNVGKSSSNQYDCW